MKHSGYGPDRNKASTRFVRALVLIALAALLVVFSACAVCLAEENEEGEEIPWSLLSFKEKYPEAAGFVDSYPEKHVYQYEVDLDDEVTQGRIPLFIQWDERWGYVKMDRSYIGVSGCGPTCLSMVVCGLTGSADWNPKALSAYAVEHKYYRTGSGTSWDLMVRGAEDLGLIVEEGEITEAYIMEKLSLKSPIICSMKKGDFTYTGHYIVLCGKTIGGRILIHDPNSPDNSNLSWEVSDLLPQIKALWAYSLPDPKEES